VSTLLLYHVAAIVTRQNLQGTVSTLLLYHVAAIVELLQDKKGCHESINTALTTSVKVKNHRREVINYMNSLWANSCSMVKDKEG